MNLKIALALLVTVFAACDRRPDPAAMNVHSEELNLPLDVELVFFEKILPPDPRIPSQGKSAQRNIVLKFKKNRILDALKALGESDSLNWTACEALSKTRCVVPDWAPKKITEPISAISFSDGSFYMISTPDRDGYRIMYAEQ